MNAGGKSPKPASIVPFGHGVPDPGTGLRAGCLPCTTDAYGPAWCIVRPQIGTRKQLDLCYVLGITRKTEQG